MAINKAVTVIKSKPKIGYRKINSKVILYSIWELLVLLSTDTYVWVYTIKIRLFVIENHSKQLAYLLHMFFICDLPL